jgi:hypothetical protein
LTQPNMVQFLIVRQCALFGSCKLFYLHQQSVCDGLNPTKHTSNTYKTA